MTRGRYRRSEDSRERILAAATELFAQNGYAGTGVDRLAARSGIAKTAIYYHFGNKEGLLAAVLERAANTWIDAINEASRLAGGPLAQLERALTGMRTMVEERPWILKLLVLLALEVAGDKPDIRTRVRGIFLRARGTIVAGMRDAFGGDVPGAEEVAEVMLALLDGFAVRQHVDPELSLDAAFGEMRRITTFMLVTRLDPELCRWFDDPPGDLRDGLRAYIAKAQH